MEKEPNIKIFVTHFNKPDYIYEDDVFVPIQAGKKNSKIDLGIQGDDTGDNISGKNSQYAELTTQYWVRKNYDLSDVDYVGFCHYRRYMVYNYKYNFCRFWNNMDNNQSAYGNIISVMLYILGQQINLPFSSDVIKNSSISIKDFLNKYPKDAYLTKEQFRIQRRPLYHMGLYTDELWNILYKIIIEKYPDYASTIRYIERQFWRNGCNIGILKKSLFFEYSQWLFDILFDFEKILGRNDLMQLGINDNITAGTRFLGCLGERLFNCWLYHKKREGYKISHHANLLFFKI